ncbi:tetratricopeptide repeat protein [Actinoplanes sp. NBRC 103695]|uniref:tetratricopeptide repeat protein n=1 Tax=Actinoplanes sp. NBRC 103695 TaxID=3032202 RepID=UPI002556EA0E|nr:tetratricopeptide repeat protein [Actinoplanes sp. NBRC 103695]
MSQPSPLEPARQRAQYLAEQGDPGGAIAMLEHAVSLGRANLGEDDPGVLGAAHHLARLHQMADDPSAARRVLEEAYAAGQWRLGDADPLMLEISFDLGVVAEELGNRHEARKALGRVVELGKPVLGDGHWAVLKARAYLAGNHGAIAHSAPVPEMAPEVAPQRDIASLAAPREVSAEPIIPRQGGTPLVRRVPGAQTPPLPEEYPQASLKREAPVSQAPMQTGWPVERGPVESAPVETAPVETAPVESAQQGGGWPAQTGPTANGPAQGGGWPGTPEPYRPFDDLAVHRPFGGGESPRIAAGKTEAPAAPVSAYSRKGPAIFAAVAAVLAVSLAVIALVFVLADRGDKDDGKDSDVPTLGGGPAPAGVQVRDYGTSVEITWTDPSDGKTSTLITGGHPGEVLKPMGEVGPGQTRFELRGLNDQLDYCFAVVAVYGVNSFSPSEQSCTSRPEPGKTG